MTFNWGHKLILVFIVFGSLMTFMVYKSVKTNFDLVSTEYYKDELFYQQIIDGTNEANLLKEDVSVVMKEETVVVKLPAEMKNEIIKGELWFYCATDAKKDRKINIQMNADAEQVINAKMFAHGNYMLKLTWSIGSRQFYAEQNLTIQ